MGLFDFARNAGAAIGIGKSTKEIDAEKAAKEAAAKAAEDAAAKSAAAAAAAKDEAEKAKHLAEQKAQLEKAQAVKAAEMLAEAKKSEELEKYVLGLGLNVTNLDIKYDDHTAWIGGTVPSQADLEKVVLAVGNVNGVAKVDESLSIVAPAQAPVEAAATFHTVEAGDTLSKVAKRVYGDASKYPVIFEANKPMLKDPDKIFVGQVLRCPAL